MKCKGIYKHICENLDEDLGSPKCREIKRHLEACPDCQAFLDALKKTVLLYRAMPTPHVSGSTRRKLYKVINLLSPEKSTRKRKGTSRTSSR